MLNILDEITEISQRIKAQEPAAITPLQKQATIVMAALERNVIDLIMEHMAVKIIFVSLFYFWVTLEAPLLGVSEQALDRWKIPLPDAVEGVISVIKSTLDALPNHQPTADMKRLGERINIIKSLIPGEEIDRDLSPDEVTRQVTTVNTRIHTTTANFLRQSYHPEIVANVLFGYWLRILTICGDVPESYYQKMEYYFDELRKVVREYVPTLFCKITCKSE